MCQCHGSKYDITSGAVLHGPATEPLATYEVREQDGKIQVRV
jgi:3-phenylpropionate/trans-cinnamate dioxygenase ferredoxin component